MDQAVPKDYLAKYKHIKDSIQTPEEFGKRLKRGVYLNLPTKIDAERHNVDLAGFQAMQLAAINADYSRIAANARLLEALLESGRKVRVTAPQTKLSFSLKKHPVTINDGVITQEEANSGLMAERFFALPAGIIWVVADEQSATGKVFVPQDRCGDMSEVKLTNATYHFVKGKVQQYQAEAGQECFDQYARKEAGFLQFSGFTIGLNPAFKHNGNAPQMQRPFEAEGMVHIMIGGDAWYGGNKTGQFFGFPIEKATVEIDGKTIIREGKMVWSGLASK